jgi:hypothetical protein
MSVESEPVIDAAAVGALLRAAGAPVPQERHAALLDAAAYVVAAGRRLAAAGLDHCAPLTDPAAAGRDG